MKKMELQCACENLVKTSLPFFAVLLEEKKYWNNFQEQDFLRDLEIPPFSSLLRSTLIDEV